VSRALRSSQASRNPASKASPPPVRSTTLTCRCFAEKTLTPEIGFCTCVTQRDYHRYITLRRLDPSIC
jgi:hypothetical protein